MAAPHRNEGDELSSRPRPTSSVAPDCAGQDFFARDAGLQQLLALHLPPPLHQQLLPHFRRLGVLAGGRLDELARIADRHPPVLHPRDRQGRDEDWIEYHPAYREMEQIAFGDFQLHAMSHRSGVFGFDAPMHPVAKYAFQYLFVQAEFGLMCPVSVSDTSAYLIRKYASPELQRYLLPRMLSADLGTLWKGTQFITEKSGGSDVGAIETVAKNEDGTWRLYGEKWFCSHTDADIVLLLARPEGALSGTKGLALFAMPRRLEDGTRNTYRIVRLKDKLGTRSMASGEIRLEGAVSYLVGDRGAGFRQMLDQINLSRLSHGIRAAAMMRRCLNESLTVARSRLVFGKPIIEHPLLRRQLMKIMVSTEQALSMSLFAASMMAKADAGSEEAADALRILTPLIKFRACRDNLSVATGAMEVRGGNGYIEEWVNARLVRDAHIGVLWEGTSNINALDVVRRAVGRAGAHNALSRVIRRKLEQATALPQSLSSKLRTVMDRAILFAESVAADARLESQARRAASSLYHATSAILLAAEGSANPSNARRALIAHMLLEHQLTRSDPIEAEPAHEDMIAVLLEEEPVTWFHASSLLEA